MLTNREVETRIIKQLLKDAFAKEYTVSVSLERGFDIEDMLLGSTDVARILEEVFAGHECHVFFHKAGEPLTEDGSIVCAGWVYLVLGNGPDVIADYNTKIEALLTDAMAIADKGE